MSTYGIECLVLRKLKRCHFLVYQIKGTKGMYTNGPTFCSKGARSALSHLLAWILQVQVSDWLNMYNNEIKGTQLKHEAGNVRFANCHTCIRECTEKTNASAWNSFGFASIYSRKEKVKDYNKGIDCYGFFIKFTTVRSEVRRHSKWIAPINHRKWQGGRLYKCLP